MPPVISPPLLPNKAGLPAMRRASGPSPVTGPTNLRRVFFWAAGILSVLITVRGIGEPFGDWLGAFLIVWAALLPNYLWVIKRVTGLPIYPLCALTTIWIYALPLVSEHPMVMLFAPASRLTAALSVTGFLLLGTGAWYLVARKNPKPRTTFRALNEDDKDWAIVFALSVVFAISVAFALGWVNSTIASIIRAILLAMEALLCFILSYRQSLGKLSAPLRAAFYLLMGGTMLVDLTSLLLINVVALTALCVLAYTVGSRRLPWRLCLAAAMVFGTLHYGKSLMREKYWRAEDGPVPIAFSQYPSFFAEWIKDSHDIYFNGDDEDQPESLTQRASLMHLLIYIQVRTPQDLPYLYGASYQPVLVQFVPRIFYPDKPRSHEGTYIVGIYYGLITREDIDVVTVDIGLINEAYANFGFAGMAALAVILGGGFGAVSNYARHAPILSFRALFAISVLGSILQASSSASFYIATLFQSTSVLAVFSLLFMRPMRSNTSINHCLD